MEIRLKTEKIYSIRELNNLVKGILNQEFPDQIWVHGEIQDYDRSKHKPDVYFSLCEKHPEIDQIIAQVRVVIFGQDKERISQILKHAENSFELRDNLDVKFLCKVDLFPRSGQFILVAKSIDPVYTLGKLAQNRQRLIAELKEKGILDRNKALLFPLVPLNIGLITSFNSAAYHDFLSELRLSGYGFKVYFFNSYMQGEMTESDVCLAIDIFDRLEELDLIVIIRGGGSTADLSWFDNRKIAEKIAFSKLPVLSGIGHEINVTITDLASFKFMKTPTAIAQFLVERVREFLEEIDRKIESILEKSKDTIKGEKQNLRLLSTNIDSQTNRFLRFHREDVSRKSSQIQMGLSNLIINLKKDLSKHFHDLKRYPFEFIKLSLTKIRYFEDKTKILDPMNVVKRGFSITKRKEGKIVRSIKDVKKEAEISTIVCDGLIDSQVKDIRKEE